MIETGKVTCDICGESRLCSIGAKKFRIEKFMRHVYGWRMGEKHICKRCKDAKKGVQE